MRKYLKKLYGMLYPAKPKSSHPEFGDEEFSTAQQDFVGSIRIEFLFSEFGAERQNGGGSDFNKSERLNPSLATLRRYFPNADYTVYSDFDLAIEGVRLKKVESPLKDRAHPRFGYRTADYFKFIALCESTADFRCIIDSDMAVVSPDIIALLYLTKKFGFCVPYNDRQLLRQDMQDSKDTAVIQDDSLALGHSYNQSPMTLWKGDGRGKTYFETCAEIMLAEPSRASLVMWKAAWKTGIYPYILPKQWCVCTGQEGIGNEILLHVGHRSVAEFYDVEV